MTVDNLVKLPHSHRSITTTSTLWQSRLRLLRLTSLIILAVGHGPLICWRRHKSDQIDKVRKQQAMIRFVRLGATYCPFTKKWSRSRLDKTFNRQKSTKSFTDKVLHSRWQIAVLAIEFCGQYNFYVLVNKRDTHVWLVLVVTVETRRLCPAICIRTVCRSLCSVSLLFIVYAARLVLDLIPSIILYTFSIFAILLFYVLLLSQQLEFRQKGVCRDREIIDTAERDCH